MDLYEIILKSTSARKESIGAGELSMFVAKQTTLFYEPYEPLISLDTDRFSMCEI